MTELISTSKLVKVLLEQDERTRNSDSYLYLRVIDEIGTRKEIPISEWSVTTFLLHGAEWGFPSFETVRRTRQKVQAEHPELAGAKRVREKRSEREKVFREFAVTHNVTE